MNFTHQLQAITANLRALSGRSRILLAVAALSVTLGVMLFAYVLNAPAKTALYTEVSREELSRMSRILSANGISFDSDIDRGSISVDPNKMEGARLLLAEHGLPSGASAGYELFDEMNSLGLTSFMQEVTKTRAIEGELARTIQMLSGIRAARVHLVLPKDRTLRARASDAPTASVVISSTATVEPATATSIRYLVAGAVRGLDISNVTVLRTDGTLVSSAGDDITGGSIRLAEMESRYERELADKINAALGPHLGEENYRVSVTAKLNNDQRRTDETIFMPESQVERSVRVVRQNGTSENKSASSGPASVTENFPEEETTTPDGQSARESTEKRDELTNYEISQKKVQTVSEGYKIEKLTVALVVNQARLNGLIGDNGSQQEIQSKLENLKTTVRAAIGYSQERGDLIEVTALEFLPLDALEAESAGRGLGTFLTRNFSTILNSLTAIGGVLVLVFLVIRPILRQLAATPAGTDENPQPGAGAPARIASGFTAQAGGAEGTAPVAPVGRSGEGHGRITDQLVELIEQSEERAAHVIRDWVAADGGLRQ